MNIRWARNYNWVIDPYRLADPVDLLNPYPANDYGLLHITPSQRVLVMATKWGDGAVHGRLDARIRPWGWVSELFSTWASLKILTFSSAHRVSFGTRGPATGSRHRLPDSRERQAAGEGLSDCED